MSFQRKSAKRQTDDPPECLCKIYVRPVPDHGWILRTDAPHRSYGFDPLGLAAPADLRSRFQEAELIHSRWAMAGVAGALAVELAGQGNWITAQTWVCMPLSVWNCICVSAIGMMVICHDAGKRWRKPHLPRHPTPIQLWHNSSIGMLLQLQAQSVSSDT